MAVRIGAINYLNTIPFLYGLENSSLSKEIELITCTPSQAADKLVSNEIDLGIIPVATLLEPRNSFKVVSDFCIASDKHVKSVLLCSSRPLEEIDHIYLDNDSMTSAMLIRVLARNYWKINPKYTTYDFNKTEVDLNESYLLIGDKALMHSDRFKYQYDLAVEWYNFKSLPFVFALWVSNKDLDPAFLERFNHALDFGVSSIKQSVKQYNNRICDKEALEYLSTNISYSLDDSKHKALEEYFNLAGCIYKNLSL